MPSLILVFDFDKTILDNDSDRAVLEHFNLFKEVEQKVFKEKQQWTRVCDELYHRLTKQQIEEAINKHFKVQPGMIELMNEIGKMQQEQKETSSSSSSSSFFPSTVTSIYLVLCTDSNEFFIRRAFEKFFPNTRIDLLHTNPVTWDSEGQHMNVHWCEKDGHNCDRCNKAGLPNMCKGLCVDRLIKNPPIDDDPVVYFFGDGYNDMCAVAHLRACDSAFVRRDHSLHTKCIVSPVVMTPTTTSFPTSTTSVHSTSITTNEILLKDGINDANFRGVCRLVPWTDGSDLLIAVKQHLNHTIATLPPLNILSEEENTFRFYSQKVRIPKTLRDTFKSSLVSDNEEIKNKIEQFADSVEKNGPVPDELVEFGYDGSSAPTKDKMRKAIGNLPWLHGEMAIHRYLDWIIRQQHPNSSSSSPLPPIQSIQEDFWASHKMEAIEHALPWICSLIVQHEGLWSLSSSTTTIGEKSSLPSSEALQDEFTTLLMHELQGNIADLCFRSSSDLGNMFEPSLVRDDRKRSAKYLVEKVLLSSSSSSSNKKNTISLCDVVVDNAGPELAADILILACVLGVAAGASSPDQNISNNKHFYTRLIVKDRPYYVSDTVPHDVKVLLDALEDYVNKKFDTKNTTSEKKESVLRFVQVIRDHITSSAIQILPADWTTKALEFRDLGFESTLFGFFVPSLASASTSSSWPRNSHAPNYDENNYTNSILSFLPKTQFVIVKGDLNYRRLVSDRKWPVSTSFHRVLDESIFRHLPVASVRTLKCEVLVGIPKEVEEKFNNEDDKKNDPIFGWRVNGQRGVITFAEPR